jgi:outer membrane protein assembly factor BamB
VVRPSTRECSLRAGRVRSLPIALAIVLAASVLSGQQPKRKLEPYIAPLLPAEQAWKVTLPAPPAAGAAMDATSVYVALEELSRDGEEREGEPDAAKSKPGVLIALNRLTGSTRWTVPIASQLPPVATHGAIVVATAKGIEALDPEQGQARWMVALDRPVRAPMIAQGALLLAVLEGDELVAIHLDRHQIAWRRSIGESGPLSLAADEEAVYVATAGSRIMRVQLDDGDIEWERRLAGELTEPVVDRDRVFVGSNANLGSFWSIDVRSGKPSWAHRGKIFGGAVVGAVVKDDTVFVVSKDSIIRALERGDGGQRWKSAIGSRPILPPHLLERVVVVTGTGVAPVLATFRTDTGAALSTWPAPSDGVLVGRPLIDEPAPFRVSIVAIFRDGQAMGLRSTAMLFKEPPLAPFTALPGRALPREK